MFVDWAEPNQTKKQTHENAYSPQPFKSRQLATKQTNHINSLKWPKLLSRGGLNGSIDISSTLPTQQQVRTSRVPSLRILRLNTSPPPRRLCKRGKWICILNTAGFKCMGGLEWLNRSTACAITDVGSYEVIGSRSIRYVFRTGCQGYDMCFVYTK